MTLRQLVVRSRRPAAVVATAAWALAAIVFLAGSADAQVALGARSFSDVVGDAGAPDITKVAVEADPSGTLRISVTAGGMFAIDRGWEPDLSIWLDTDSDASTGSSSGCEFGLSFWRSPSGPISHVVQWDDGLAKWVVATKSPTATFTTSGDVLAWQVAPADIGAAPAFRFWLASAIYDSHKIVAEDIAPGTGRWTFDPAAAPAAFRDQAHDAAAPDITTIAVTTDATSGVTKLAATARGLSSIGRTLKPDIDVYLDTDGNESTGSFGADYRLSFAVRPGGTVWQIYRWQAKAWRAGKRSPLAAFGRRGDVVTWRFGRADIGNAQRFGFSLASSIRVSENNQIADFAPEYGRWAYTLPARSRRSR